MEKDTKTKDDYQLIAFFEKLFEIDKRINPDLYKLNVKKYEVAREKI